MMTTDTITFRVAEHLDCDAVAAVFRRSRKFFLPHLPDLHSFEEDKAYFRKIAFRECDIWVAEEEQKIVGFCAFNREWVEHLYLLPGYTRRRIGQALLAKAKEKSEALQLWVFQANVDAISFYERNGFVKVRETDGSECQEKMPDALYRWMRGSASAKR
jgi:ribosomal protein S18 acetylase RimI-like enzyme